MPDDRSVSKKERITIRLTKKYMDLLDKLVDKGAYTSKNEAIRAALRLLFEKHDLNLVK